MTNVLKIIVKCWEGEECRVASLPLSMSNIRSPVGQVNNTPLMANRASSQWLVGKFDFLCMYECVCTQVCKHRIFMYGFMYGQCINILVGPIPLDVIDANLTLTVIPVN